MNAGVAQENIKFPEKYRKAINKRLLTYWGLILMKEYLIKFMLIDFWSNTYE